MQIKHFTAPQKMPNFQFSRRAKWPWQDKILGAPQRGKKIIITQSKPHLVIISIKLFTCQSFRQNYFSREIEWAVWGSRKYACHPHGRDRIFSGEGGVNLTNFQVGRVLLTRKRVTKKKHETFKTTIYLRRIRMNEHSEDILSVPWRGSTIGLAGCGIWLFFFVILGMRAENRSGMWAFNNHGMRES